MKISEEIKKLVPYQPGKPIEETKREYGLTDVVKLASNENPLGPSPKVLEAIQRAALEVHRYPDGAAYELKKVCADHFGVTEKQLLFGNGSNELIDLLIRLYCLPGDKIITSQAAFIAYKICAQAARVETIEVPLRSDFVFDFEKLTERIQNDWSESHKLIFIPNPNNPTGTYVGQSEVKKFLDQFGSRDDMMIVFDEAYSEYVTAEDHPNALDFIGEYQNVIVLRTLSKAYGLAALRVGIMFASEEVIDLLDRIRMPFNVNSLAQEAAIAALKDIEYVQKSREVNSEGLRYFYDSLNQLQISYVPSQGNFVLFESPLEAGELVEKMLKKGVILRPLKGYGFDKHVRMSVGLADENQKAISALSEVLGRSL